MGPMADGFDGLDGRRGAGRRILQENGRGISRGSDIPRCTWAGSRAAPPRSARLAPSGADGHGDPTWPARVCSLAAWAGRGSRQRRRAHDPSIGVRVSLCGRVYAGQSTWCWVISFVCEETSASQLNSMGLYTGARSVHPWQVGERVDWVGGDWRGGGRFG